MSKPTLKFAKPQSDAERTTLTTTDTLEVTPAIVKAWKNPPFQRELRTNERLLGISQEIAETGVIPGAITLGVLGSDTYLIDGQHRREAFLLADVQVGYVDVRVAHYKTLADMAEEFWKLNSRISIMRPDDFLRAIESSETQLVKLRKRCPFVGYGHVRRSDKGSLLSMSALLRAWWSTSKDVPTGGGISAVDAARSLGDDECEHLGDFLEVARAAWGSDPEYHRLWNTLNLSICMWLYRRTVLSTVSPRSTHLTKEHFKKCLTALSASGDYLEWLRNRGMSDKNRSPAYRRVKDVFARRLTEELGVKPVLPAPEWGGQ